MELSKQAKYHGLMNQGATCYLNSVLQVLFMTEDFRESVKKNNAGTEHIDTELRDLFEDLERYTAYTYKITNKLRIENVYEQRDAAEHYEKILRLSSPEAAQIFHGELINKNICRECQTIIPSTAGFWSLPLPLVNNNNEYSVEKGIEDFFRSSEISGDDQMYCETCDKKCDAVLVCEVKHYPEVLVLLLKRFEFDYRYMTYVKINQPVNVPQTLRMSENHLYNLYAIVEHSGELRFGHYISIIRSQNDDRWYLFNDSMAPYGASPKLERSHTAYLLFYRKETHKDNTSNEISKPAEKEQVPAKPENEEIPTKPLKRTSPFDENQQEFVEQQETRTRKNKKQKQELSVDEDVDKDILALKGQKCQDLNNSSIRHMCDRNVPGLKEERRSSECSVDKSSMGFSDYEQHKVKDESIEHVKQEPQPEMKQLFASMKTDQLSHLYPNQETFEIVQTETRKEECFIKLHLEQNVNNQGSETRENDFKGFGRYEGLQSCSDVDVNRKITMGNNEVMAEKIEASENTEQLSQMKPNQEKCDKPDNLGAETIVNGNNGKTGRGEDRSEFNPGLPLGFSNQNEQTIEIMTTEKQEQGTDQSEKTFLAINAEGTIGRTNEDDCNKRQCLRAGGRAAIDEVMLKTDNSTDDTNCSEVNTLSMSGQPYRTAYVKLDEREMNKLCLLGESGKNSYEKVEKDSTDDEISHRIHAWDFLKDSDSILGLSSEPLSKSQSMERLMSVEGNNDKAGSFCKNNVGGDIVQSSNMDIKAAYKKSDPGCSASVNQNYLRQSSLTMQKDEAGVQGEKNDEKMNVEQMEITEKSDLSLEDPQRTESQIDAKVKPMNLTKYDLYLDSVQSLKDGNFNKSQTDKIPRPQSLPVTETECKAHNFEKREMKDNLKEQVMSAREPCESCVVIIEGDEEMYPNQETFTSVQTETRKEECSVKPHLEQSANNQGSKTREIDCEGFGRYEGLQSFSDIDVNSKIAMGNNEVMEEKMEISENTGQLSQMKPNQEKCDQMRPDNLGTEPIVNANDDKGGGGESRSEFNPGFPLGFNNQNEQKIEIMQTEMARVQKSGQTESQECSINSDTEQKLVKFCETSENCSDEGLQSSPDNMMTEKQEQGSDQSEKTFLAMNTEGTIRRTNEDDFGKRQGVSAGGRSAEINLNNAIDEVMHKTDNSTDDINCSELNTLSMSRQPERTAYVKLDKREMNRLYLLGESGKNGDEKVEKDCTNSQLMERPMSVDGNNDKATSYCKDNVGGDIAQSSNMDIKAAHLSQSSLILQKDVQTECHHSLKDISLKVHESEKREMTDNLKEQVTFDKEVFESCHVIIEGDEEVRKFILRNSENKLQKFRDPKK